jgi:hypothetical protein
MPNTKTKHSNTGLSNAGKKWTTEEENILLEELNNNIDIELISKSHNRTIGSISSRCQLIAYNMYTNNIPMEEICQKTKLNESEVRVSIERFENKIQNKKIKNKKLQVIFNDLENKEIKNENDITEIKKDIKEIKNNIKELVAMMKALYEFEHS